MIGDRLVRVLIVSRATALWGAERRILSLVPLLEGHRIRCTLACGLGTPLALAWTDAGFAFRPIELPDHVGLRRSDGGRSGPVALLREAGTTLLSASRLAGLAREFDVIWSNSLSAHLEVALAGRAARKTTILHLHDMVAPGLGRRVLATAVRVADHAIALTEAVAACAGTAVRSKISIIHNGIDPTVFAPGVPDPATTLELGGGPGRHVVGILGRIDPEKGIETVVRAVAHLPPELDVRLVVVGATLTGGTCYQESLLAEARATLGDRVRFLAPRDDVPQILRSLDVLVNASPAEPFGRTILEAQASGIPVVAVSGGGVPEFVADGVTGLLVPPGDHAAMARALERVLTDSTLRAGLISRARADVLAHRTLEQQAQATAAVVRHVAQGLEPARQDRAPARWSSR